MSKPPPLTFVFQVRATVEPPLELGTVDGVRKRIIPVTSGDVTGPRLTGQLLPGGADWQNILSDGTTKLFARYTVRATDGTLIAVNNAGIRRGPPEVLQRMMAGEVVDPSLYYFRTTPSFDVGPGNHHWLTENIFVCKGARSRDHVVVDFFLVG